MSKADASAVATDRGAYVVTGAGSGLNFEITRRLLDAGCTVSAWDITAGRLSELSNPRLTFLALDVRDRGAQVRAAEATAAASGGIAGALTGAGVMPTAPFLEYSEADFDRVLAINLKGTLFTLQAVLPHMRRAKAGAIVMFSSTLARAANPGACGYIASKGGVLGLMRSLALETAEDGIRVNSISPGLADTPMPRAGRSQNYMDERAGRHPMGRLAMPADIADAAMFLLSDDASYLTGQDIRVEGGRTLF